MQWYLNHRTQVGSMINARSQGSATVAAQNGEYLPGQRIECLSHQTWACVADRCLILKKGDPLTDIPLILVWIAWRGLIPAVFRSIFKQYSCVFCVHTCDSYPSTWFIHCNHQSLMISLLPVHQNANTPHLRMLSSTSVFLMSYLYTGQATQDKERQRNIRPS